MRFDEEYFRNLKYLQRGPLIKRHILEVLRGSEVSNSNLLDGQGKTALDVGCAYGYAIDLLESFGYDAYCVNISGYSVKQARRIMQPTLQFVTYRKIFHSKTKFPI